MNSTTSEAVISGDDSGEEQYEIRTSDSTALSVKEAFDNQFNLSAQVGIIASELQW